VRYPANKSDQQLLSLTFRRNTHGFVPILTDRVVANSGPRIRAFSGHFLHNGGQPIISMRFCPLRRMLKNRNVTAGKKMTEKALFVAIVLFSFVVADPHRISHNSE
jgi:hypothetical protein